MCAYANSQFDDPIQASAHLLWRINWIHPFYDGNGRVAREMAILALLTQFGSEWEGADTISILMNRRRVEYYRVLAEADQLSRSGEYLIGPVESFIASLIVEQSDIEQQSSSPLVVGTEPPT